MLLASAWDEHRSELIADFQDTYSLNIFELNLDGNPTEEQLERACALLTGLPENARCIISEYPEAQVTYAEKLLNQIEFDVRSGFCNTKTKREKPMPLPYEAKAKVEQDNQAEKDRKELDALLQEAFG